MTHLLEGRAFALLLWRASGSQDLVTAASGGGVEKDDEDSKSARSAEDDDEALRKPTGLTALREGRASLRRAQPRRAPRSRRAMVEVLLA